MPNKVLAAEYQMTLPDEKILAAELDKTQKMLQYRLSIKEQRTSTAKVEKMDLNREKILRTLVQEKGKLTISTYVKEAQISRTTAYRNLLQAINNGWLKRYGKGRNTYYVLLYEQKDIGQ